MTIPAPDSARSSFKKTLLCNGRLTIKQIQAALNIAPSQVTTRRQSGFLLPSVEGKGHRPLWDLAEARAFLERVSQDAVQVSEGATEWEEIGKAVLRLRIPPGDIIHMRLAGELRSLGQRSGKPGYQGLLVKPAEVKARMALLPDDVLNIEDFAKKVGLRWPAARRLTTTGLIPSTLQRNPASGLMQAYVSPTDLAEFKRRFVTLITLGEELGLPWQQLVSWFRKADIAKVTAEGRDFSQFYERRMIPPDWFSSLMSPAPDRFGRRFGEMQDGIAGKHTLSRDAAEANNVAKKARNPAQPRPVAPANLNALLDFSPARALPAPPNPACEKNRANN